MSPLAWLALLRASPWPRPRCGLNHGYYGVRPTGVWLDAWLDGRAGRRENRVREPSARAECERRVREARRAKWIAGQMLAWGMAAGDLESGQVCDPV